MKTRLKTLGQGYLSIIKELFSIKNKQEYFILKLNPFWMLLILGAVGVLRNVMEVLFNIKFLYNPADKWYSMDGDILFTMFFFPVSLCFFGAFVIHIIFRAFNLKIPYLKLVSFAFYLQILQLIVPFFDIIALRYQIKHSFILPEFLHFYPYFAFAIAISLGIIVVWVLTMYMMVKVFVKHFNQNLFVTIGGLLIAYLILFIPIYYIFPIFNIGFNLIAGIEADPFNLFWGYGVFFMISGLFGMWYYRIQIRKKNIK